VDSDIKAILRRLGIAVGLVLNAWYLYTLTHKKRFSPTSTCHYSRFMYPREGQHYLHSYYLFAPF